MAIKTALTERFDLEHPIVLAPMAGVAGGALAAAVGNAGALGIVGGGYGDPVMLEQEMAAAGNTPVGIGFITWRLSAQPDLIDLALQRKPKAMFLSFGDVSPFAEKVHDAGVPLIAQVQTLAQARAALDAGADILVAQGTEAGGHGGARATFPLVPAVVDLAAGKNVPVLAAGGIADGRGLAAALMLGAAGAVCGTAFYAAREALSSENAKSAAVRATGDDTERGSVFDITRGFAWPADWDLRTLKNRYSDKWRGNLEGLRSNLEDETEVFQKAVAAGDTDIAPVIVGEGAGMITAVEPAAEIVARISRDAENLLRNAGNFIRA